MLSPSRCKAMASLVLSAAALLCSLLAAGCNPVAWWANLRAPEVYVPSDSAAELRGPARVKVWAHDKSGKLIRGYVNAGDRWLICPPAYDTQKPMAEIAQGN